MEHYDIVCVGGGIAGLYTAYRALKSVPLLKVAVIESSNRFGGRILTRKWRGVRIIHGAGVARLDKDFLLVSLLADVNLWADPYVMHVRYHGFSKKDPHVMRTLKQLLKEWVRRQPAPASTFRAFATECLGEAGYRELRDAIGYTDYELADAHDTLFDYGFNDAVEGGTMGAMPWKELIERMVQRLKKWGCTMIKQRPVQRVQENERGRYTVDCGPQYPILTCNKLVLAVPTPFIAPLWRLSMPPPIVYERDVPTQPFLRIYAQIDRRQSKAFEAAIQGYTVVRPPVQKIIPIHKKKGVYMIAYADNENAERLRHTTAPQMQAVLQDTLNVPVVLKHIKIVYWKHGTHYYAPLSTQWPNRDAFVHAAQRPAPRMFVVGESLSRNQGWTQGALESVEAVFSEIIQR